MDCLLAALLVCPDPTLSLPMPTAHAFQMPVGAPDGRGFYDAQPFGVNTHLGSDYNAVTGGDSDLGMAVSAVALGVVREATDHKGGWGNVVRIVHSLPDGTQVESLYAHLDSVDVLAGQRVEKGAVIGTIGTAHGRYLAHLHFELRMGVGAALGPGYGEPEQGQVDPGAFLEAHR